MKATHTLVALFFSVLAFHKPAHAQNVPAISPSLKQALSGLPIADIKGDLKTMVGALKKTSCGGNLTGCYMTQSGPLQLYFFTSGQSQQTLLLVVDKKMAMPRLLGEKAQKVMGETSLASPIVSISTTDFELDQIKMPPALQKVVRDSYFNINTLSFSSGVQVAARANLGGPIKLTMESMGVKADQLMMRAAVVMPIPTDLASAAGTGASAADAAHSSTLSKAGADAMKPEAYVEFQFAPNASLPLLLPRMTLTDATFFLNNALTFGFKGNAAFKGAESKKVIMHFQTPLSPAGAMDLLDFSFRMATPANFTMEDSAHMMVSMATSDSRLAKYGGGFIRNIGAFKDPLLTMTKPLSVVQLRNPNPPPEYRFGDSSKPFPHDNKYFNFALLGPLAEGGPLLNAAGDVAILGQKMGWLYASAGQSGLLGDAGEMLLLKLGPLGDVKIKMQATMAINADKQDFSLMGNLDGQKILVGLSGNTMSVEVSASCVNPFEINTKVAIEASTNIADVFKGQGGVNVDPSKISGCLGKELEAAYNKIANEYSHLEGFTASQANAALNQIANGAEQTYNQAKEEARKAAEASISAANKAWTGGTSAAISAVGGSTAKIPDTTYMHFDRSVFDWDYYYDTFDIDRYTRSKKGLFGKTKPPQYPGSKPKSENEAPQKTIDKSEIDLVKHWDETGHIDRWRGSLEYDPVFYAKTYPDATRYGDDWKLVMQDWINLGIAQGRMGSDDFDTKSYLARYSDLQRIYGIYGYQSAFLHWLSNGKAENRDGRPFTASPVPVGSSYGGAPWDDFRLCKGLHVTGFAVRAGSKVDGLAFQYANGVWGPPHGKLGNKPYTAEVILAKDEYIVRVDYRSNDEVYSIGFTTNKGRRFGPYGGGNTTPSIYTVMPGQKLSCMQGRSGDRTDQLTFSSTRPL